jgi:hypothetical protein
LENGGRAFFADEARHSAATTHGVPGVAVAASFRFDPQYQHRRLADFSFWSASARFGHAARIYFSSMMILKRNSPAVRRGCRTDYCCFWL